MAMNQNETGSELGVMSRESRVFARHALTRAPRPTTRAFTLTELLVVITIIAVLASLITVAVSNALRKANQARITLEIQQLSSAMDDLRNDIGVYPPNVFRTSDISANERNPNLQNLVRSLKRVSSRSSEYNTTSPANQSDNNITPITNGGLSPAEALVFWLQGFSQDVSRPLSGTDLITTAIEYENPVDGSIENRTDVITIDTRSPRFDFDRGRLRMSSWPTTGNRRFIEVNRQNGNSVQIQLYEYLAPNSEEPYVYFDTSRETPEQVVANWSTTEFFYSSPNGNGNIYPLKQMRADAPSNASTVQFVEYVNRDKFQILHCGLDDAWGNFSRGGSGGQLDLNNVNFIPPLLFPDGPYIGDIADTVGNFGTGTLADEQE